MQISKKMSIKFGMISNPPGVMSCALQDHCRQSGFAFDAAKIVCEKLRVNCTFDWYNTTDYGDVDQNGNASGLLGAIQRGDFDSSVPVFTPTFRRFNAISFSDIYFYFDVLFATRAPDEQLGLFDWSIVYSFHWRTWCVFIAALILTSFVFSCASRFCSDQNSNAHPIGALVNTCASLVSMKGGRNSGNNPFLDTGFARSLLIVWTLAGLVLTSAYTGMLFSQKVTSANGLPFVDFETLVECLEWRKCRLIAHTISTSSMQLLEAPGSEYSTRIGNALRTNPVLITPLQEIPGRILNEKSTHLVWVWSQSSILYAIGGNVGCKFYTLQAPYKEVYTFPMRKNSSLLYQFNRMATSFRENQLAFALRDKYPGSVMCSRNWKMASRPSSANQGGALRSTLTIFCFYAIGMTAGVIAFLAEFRKRPKTEHIERIFVRRSTAETRIEDL